MPIEMPTQTPGTSSVPSPSASPTPVPITPITPAPAPSVPPAPVAPASTGGVVPPAAQKSSLPVTILIIALVALLFGGLGYFGGKYIAEMLGVQESTQPTRQIPVMETPMESTEPEIESMEQTMPAEDSSDAAILAPDEPLDLTPGSTDTLPTEAPTMPTETTPTEPTM